MPLKVNIPRVVLNRPDGYTFSKERFPKLKLLDIEFYFDCLGDGGGKADGDTTSFLDVISPDVTELTIRDLTRLQGKLVVMSDNLNTDLVGVKGLQLGDLAEKGTRHTFGELAVWIRNDQRSNTATSDRSVPPIEVLPPGHPPTQKLDAIICIMARF